MHKNATKCNKTLSKWCKNRHGASKIIDTFETYQHAMAGHFELKESAGMRKKKKKWRQQRSKGPVKIKVNGFVLK
jgi:hypothetical protein